MTQDLPLTSAKISNILNTCHFYGIYFEYKDRANSSSIELPGGGEIVHQKPSFKRLAV